MKVFKVTTINITMNVFILKNTIDTKIKLKWRHLWYLNLKVYKFMTILLLCMYVDEQTYIFHVTMLTLIAYICMKNLIKAK